MRQSQALGLDPDYQFGRNMLRAAKVKRDLQRLRALIKRAERGEPAAVAEVMAMRPASTTNA